MENKPQTPTSQSDLAKTFDPKSIEDYWYKKWEEYGFFKDDTFLSKESETATYCIQLLHRM